MNQRKLNVLQAILVKKKFRKNDENESNSSKIIINDEYYRIENIDKLQAALSETTSNKTLVNIKKINNDARLIF